ncbi:AAWKG family protein, partial [Streptomyces sp. NPDC020747]|uniref:AAWKG family protein n=1 Tax=Streptomyces sp. NPDC020747 TaxID=3365086 RepID=UPI003796454E
MAETKDVTGNNDDNWKIAVDMLTGYQLPPRNTLFDSLKGNEGIPLMHVRLDRVGGSDYKPGFLTRGGWRVLNTDYVMPFYRSGSDAEDSDQGTLLDKYRAHITFLGTFADHRVPSGDDVFGGGEHTSKHLKNKGGWNKEGEAVKWDSALLSQYVHGSVAALRHLTTYPYNTHGFTSNGRPVGDGLYVDLASFTEAAKAYDRVVTFFDESAVTLGKWDTEDIGEGSKSWDGTSAAIFKQLIHKLARNYEGYADQINGDGKSGEGAYSTIDGVSTRSEPARALAAVQTVIFEQAKALQTAWEIWKSESNPQRWLYDMLETARFDLVGSYNKGTDFQVAGSGHVYRTVVVATATFRNDIVIEGKSYGSPNDMETWKAIGAEAVRRWEQTAQDWLAAAGADAIVAVENAFRAAEKAFDTRITDKDKRTLSEISTKVENQKEKNDAQKDKDDAKAAADKDKAEARKDKDEAKAAADKDKLEAKAERDKDREEARKDKEEAKAERDKDREEARKDKEEAKAAADKDREEARKDKDEAKAAADKDRAEAKADQAAAKDEANREKAEAKADQAAAKAEADKEKAEAKAEQAAAKDEANREKAEAKAQNDQDRAEAKQQAAAQQAFALTQAKKQKDEADAEKAAAKEEQAAAKEEAKKEQAAAKAEADREKDEAKAEQAAEKAEAKKEQADARAEADAEKAEAKKEQAEAQAEAKQEQAAAKAEADAEKAEAKKEQAEAQAEAKQEQAAAKAE